MSADDPAALDLAPIRARLTSVNQERWARNTEPAIDPRFPLGTFIAHAPADIAALLAEVERLRAELALAVAVCVDCGKVTRCDEDRCCLTCGRDLILLLDQHSADVLDASLEQLGNDFVKEWSDGRAE